MPSTKKTLHYMFSALATAISVGVMGLSMSSQWAKTTMECTRAGNSFTNGSALVRLKVFDGDVKLESCPLFAGGDNFQVIPELMKSGVTPAALHTVVVSLLALCLLLSACSILISLYNSVSNPYETYMGPIGVYVCSSLSACLSVVVLVISVVNVNLTSMNEDLVQAFAGPAGPADLRNKSTEMMLGYYLVILYTALSLISVVLIYTYDHAAYTHRREQQMPTEDAPKEIMMY